MQTPPNPGRRFCFRTPSPACVGYAVAVLSAACTFDAHAASPLSDGVSLRESTITWSTVQYATDAQNGFVDGSLDKSTIVDRTFKAYVLENRYLKVTLVPEFGGRVISIIYKPTGHEQLYRTEVGVPYGMKGGNVLLRLDDGLWRHLSHLSGCRARQDLAEAVGFQGSESRVRAK